MQGLDLSVMAPISLTYLIAAQKNTDVEFIKGIATLILKCRPCPFIKFFLETHFIQISNLDIRTWTGLQCKGNLKCGHENCKLTSKITSYAGHWQTFNCCYNANGMSIKKNNCLN